MGFTANNEDVFIFKEIKVYFTRHFYFFVRINEKKKPINFNKLLFTLFFLYVFKI